MSKIVIDHPNYPPPENSMTPRKLSHITDMIVHHSAGSLHQTPLDIDAEHRSQGWAMIGYNYIITPDGKIHVGRPDDVSPSAAFGRNSESVNICLIGNFQHDHPGYTGKPTPAQIQSLKDLSVFLHTLYPTIVRTITHGDVALMFHAHDDPGHYATDCCGSDLRLLMPDIRAYTKAHLGL